ncbi:DUF1281 family ferredoxin-like fold protein [Ursidibacter sp. B-7004-1]
MPNWCQNKLEIICDLKQAELIKPKLFEPSKTGELTLNFDLLVAMPKSLLIESSSVGDRAMELLSLSQSKKITRALLKRFIRSNSELNRIYTKAKHHKWRVSNFIHWLSKRPDEQENLYLNLAIGRQYLTNLSQYGHKDWYDWSIANWGCKWNVCSENCEVCLNEDGTIDCWFDSPWGPPDAWFRVLCETFPHIEFKLSFFESGMWFAGEYIANQDGSFSEIYVEDWDIKAFAKDVFYEKFDEDDLDETD